jgi:hypothetical protein
VDDTMAGRAFQTLQVLPQSLVPADTETVTVWFPMLSGSERPGVLGRTSPERPADDRAASTRCGQTVGREDSFVLARGGFVLVVLVAVHGRPMLPVVAVLLLGVIAGSARQRGRTRAFRAVAAALNCS